MIAEKIVVASGEIPNSIQDCRLCRHSEGSLPPCLSVSLTINQRLVLCDPLMKTSQNPENQSENLWSALIYILGPWCLKLAAC